MAEQIKLVQEIRANADLVDSASAEYGPKLEQIFGTMMQEQQAISRKSILKLYFYTIFNYSFRSRDFFTFFNLFREWLNIAKIWFFA